MARDRARTVAAASRKELAVPVGTQVIDRDSGALVADLAHPGARATLVAWWAWRQGQSPLRDRAAPSARDRSGRRARGGTVVGAAPQARRRRRPARVPQRRKIVTSARDLQCQARRSPTIPFTTIAPVLGTVDSPDGRQLTVADVPGLAGRRQRRRGSGPRLSRPSRTCAAAASSDRRRGRRRGYPQAARHDQPRAARCTAAGWPSGRS